MYMTAARFAHKPLVVALLATWMGSFVHGAESSSAPAPMKLTAQQDHQKMMELLGITSLRPGANGMNPQAPNYANYDESKANPYPNLPDPLVLKNGQKVTTAEMWWKQRRPEIVEDFDREVYGRVPKDMPKVTWEVTEHDERRRTAISRSSRRSSWATWTTPRIPRSPWTSN